MLHEVERVFRIVVILAAKFAKKAVRYEFDVPDWNKKQNKMSDIKSPLVAFNGESILHSQGVGDYDLFNRNRRNEAKN